MPNFAYGKTSAKKARTKAKPSLPKRNARAAANKKRRK